MPDLPDDLDRDDLPMGSAGPEDSPLPRPERQDAPRDRDRRGTEQVCGRPAPKVRGRRSPTSRCDRGSRCPGRPR